jgi:hypothetical protein
LERRKASIRSSTTAGSGMLGGSSMAAVTRRSGALQRPEDTGQRAEDKG